MIDVTAADLNPLVGEYRKMNSQLNPVTNKTYADEDNMFWGEHYDTMINRQKVYTEKLITKYFQMTHPIERIYPRIKDDATIVTQNIIIFDPVIAPVHTHKTRPRITGFKMERTQTHNEWRTEQVVIDDRDLKDPAARTDLLLRLENAFLCMMMSEIVAVFGALSNSLNPNGVISNEGSSLYNASAQSLHELINTERYMFGCINKEPLAWINKVEPYMERVLRAARNKGLATVICSNKIRDSVVANDETMLRNDYSGSKAVANRTTDSNTPPSGMGTIGKHVCITAPIGPRLHDILYKSLLLNSVKTGDFFPFENNCLTVAPNEFVSEMRTISAWDAESDSVKRYRLLNHLLHCIEFQGEDRIGSNTLNRRYLIDLGLDISKNKGISPKTGIDYNGKEHRVSNVLRFVPNDGGNDSLSYLPCATFGELPEASCSTQYMSHFYDVMEHRIFEVLSADEKEFFERRSYNYFVEGSDTIESIYERNTDDEKVYRNIWSRIVNRLYVLSDKDHWCRSKTMTATDEQRNSPFWKEIVAGQTILHSFVNGSKGKHARLFSGTVAGALGLFDSSRNVDKTQGIKRMRLDTRTDDVFVPSEVINTDILRLRFTQDGYSALSQLAKFKKYPEFIRHAIAYPVTHFPNDETEGLTDFENKWEDTHTLGICNGLAARFLLSSVMNGSTFRIFDAHNIDIPLGGKIARPWRTDYMEHATGVTNEPLGNIIWNGLDRFVREHYHQHIIEQTISFGVHTVNHANKVYAKNICGVDYRGGCGSEYLNSGIDIHNMQDFEDMKDRITHGVRMGNRSNVPLLGGLNDSIDQSKQAMVFDMRGVPKPVDLYNRVTAGSRIFDTPSDVPSEGIEFFLKFFEECDFPDVKRVRPMPVDLTFSQEMSLYNNNFIVACTNYWVYDPIKNGLIERPSHSLWGRCVPGSLGHQTANSMIKTEDHYA